MKYVIVICDMIIAVMANIMLCGIIHVPIKHQIKRFPGPITGIIHTCLRPVFPPYIHCNYSQPHHLRPLRLNRRHGPRPQVHRQVSFSGTQKGGAGGVWPPSQVHEPQPQSKKNKSHAGNRLAGFLAFLEIKYPGHFCCCLLVCAWCCISVVATSTPISTYRPFYSPKRKLFAVGLHFHSFVSYMMP